MMSSLRPKRGLSKKTTRRPIDKIPEESVLRCKSKSPRSESSHSQVPPEGGLTRARTVDFSVFSDRISRVGKDFDESSCSSSVCSTTSVPTQEEGGYNILSRSSASVAVRKAVRNISPRRKKKHKRKKKEKKVKKEKRKYRQKRLTPRKWAPRPSHHEYVPPSKLEAPVAEEEEEEEEEASCISNSSSPVAASPLLPRRISENCRWTSMTATSYISSDWDPTSSSSWNEENGSEEYHRNNWEPQGGRQFIYKSRNEIHRGTGLDVTDAKKSTFIGSNNHFNRILECSINGHVIHAYDCKRCRLVGKVVECSGDKNIIDAEKIVLLSGTGNRDSSGNPIIPVC